MASILNGSGITLSDNSFLNTGATRVVQANLRGTGSNYEAGYGYLPMVTGGVHLVYQFGVGVIYSYSGNGASGQAYLPIPFPNNAMLNFQATLQNGRGAVSGVSGPTASYWGTAAAPQTVNLSFDGLGFSVTATRFYWFAIGY